MKTIRYRAAGGVVVQKDLIAQLPGAEVYVLLLDRPARAEVRLPKGHIDPGESAEEAALRETCEEAGYCDLQILADLGRRTVAFEYQGAQYIRDEQYYLMQLLSAQQMPRPQNDEQQFQVLWAPLLEASRWLTFEVEQLFVEDAVAAFQRLYQQ